MQETAGRGRKRRFHRVSLLLEEILLQTSRIRTAAQVFFFLFLSFSISFFRHCCDFFSYYRSADQMKPYLKMDPSPSLAINPKIHEIVRLNRPTKHKLKDVIPFVQYIVSQVDPIVLSNLTGGLKFYLVTIANSCRLRIM